MNPFGQTEVDEVEPTSPPSTFQWATITQVSPLRIRMDGESTALPITPASLVAPTVLGVGKRAWVQVHGRRPIILGLVNGGV